MQNVEEFDVVDTEDRVIGVTNKEQAHKHGFIHRVAAVYVFNASGELLVQHHRKAKLFDHSVGGHVKKGEDYDIAARREAEEELGINQPLLFLGKFYSDETFTGSSYRHMFGLYSCTVGADWVFRPNQEVAAITPMTIEYVVREMNRHPQRFTPGFLNTMDYYLATINSPLKLKIGWYKQ